MHNFEPAPPSSMMDKVEILKKKVIEAENELHALKNELAQAVAEADGQQKPTPDTTWKWPLTAGEYERYGRQLIITTVGIQGQIRLKASSVLVVGAGGLGCPAAAYLAGAGVELGNQSLNPTVTLNAHMTHLTPQNAESIVAKYDIVLDCTDHPTSRYLISDICVLLRKPLVSASAFKTDGQLIVLNSPAAPQGAPVEEGGPCYRCVFPKPPPPDSVVSCGEGGILGPVVGVMGVLQALEAIKLISSGFQPTSPSLLLFSGTAGAPFRSVRMRGRKKDCFACSPEASLTLESLESGSLDYVQFCGVAAPLNILQPEERISATEFGQLQKGSAVRVLLDVREKEHFDICSIEGAINLPLATFLKENPVQEQEPEERPSWQPANSSDDTPIYVVCRVGNDSQLATRRLKDLGLDRNGKRFIGDIKGGMRAWKDEVDSSLPFT
ncbi:hypothetical protein BJF96_g10207 [Verticillium dahliae]|uniref:Rhodanese domain-containing protein n=1 Tax=Verticillium dahliae TaxID=27337 RepID=A0AA45AHB5_VERDA|nr:hypothetical protein BJF96_g10207 [Verticillium dahliae]